MKRELRVAVVGAGPAGIYAADILTKSEVAESTGGAFGSVSVDIFDADPTPFGLIRYGVAPDHPRIKEIIKALHRVMANDAIRFFGNLAVGRDIKIDQLRAYYDAVVVATGARRDRDLDIPGVDLRGSFGGADFVAWYDAHPEAPREWDFDPDATSVAVLGVGNVGLDVARILAKTADELLTTEIPANVHAGLSTNRATDVHVFARRGPAQVKFSPMELRELSHSPSIDVIIHPDARAILESYYETRGGLTDARLRMARVPDGSELIPNRYTGAPGIRHGNVFIMAGVPAITSGMLDALSGQLEGGAPLLSETIGCWVQESEVADLLGRTEQDFEGCQIGSYPFWRDGKTGANFVIRSTDADTLAACTRALVAGLEAMDRPAVFGGIE